MVVSLLIKLNQIINADSNSTDMAPSVAEADEILARYGFVDQESLSTLTV